MCNILDGDLDSGWNKLDEKANKGLTASFFEWIGFPFSKVRWQTNVAVLLLDFLYKMLIMVKKLMVKTMAKTMVKMMGEMMMEIES